MHKNITATRQVVITHYLGPSNVRGARICARTRAGGQTVTVGYEHGMSIDRNHAAAREELCKRMGWQWREDVSWVQAPISDAENVHIALDQREVDHLFVESAEGGNLVPSLLRRQAD